MAYWYSRATQCLVFLGTGNIVTTMDQSAAASMHAVIYVTSTDTASLT